MHTVMLAVVAVAACTHHHPLTDVDDAIGEAVLVSGPTGTSHAVVTAAPGGVSFATTHGDIPAEDVHAVQDRDHWLGGLEGLGIGAAIGLGAGLVYGATRGGNDDEECRSHADCTSFGLDLDASGPVVGGLVGAAAGGLIGLAIGAISGAKVIYQREGVAVHF